MKIGKIKFGRDQIKNPTPHTVAFNVTVISIVAGVIQMWLSTAGFIPSKTSEIIQSFLGLIVALSNALKPLFGVAVSGKVPADQVEVIDDKNK